MRGFLHSIGKYLVSGLAWFSGLLIFIPMGMSVLVLSILINPKRIDRFIKAGCRLLLCFLFIRVKVQGGEHFRTKRTCLFMANHVNLFDGFVFYGHIPHFVRGVELEDHFHWPFYGWIIRRLGMIPISHTNARSALKSLQNAKQMLAAGTSIVILPEGHRTLNGKLGRFRRGAFLLAKEAGVDIIPLALVGAYAINHKGSLMIRPGKMTLRVGKPVSYHEIKELETEEIAAHIRRQISDLLTQ
ncbi:MAG: 1-acyl-sn-glycerol-3-phosphate acyltransferase [Calditrichaeota bacterium]|nr:MAG: 1-acyl-sn-glycerol-3-phosphate acyltransferase [Calditrichota bacterium]